MIRPINNNISPSFMAQRRKNFSTTQNITKSGHSKDIENKENISAKKFGLSIGLVFVTLLAGVVAWGCHITFAGKKAATQTQALVEKIKK